MLSITVKMLFPRLGFCTFVALAMLGSCAKKKHADDCCTFTDLPPAATPEGGKGRLQVEGSTAAYYDVRNEAGEHLSRRLLNEKLDLAPGRYEVSVNNASHFVDIEEGRLAKCATGTLMLSGHTEETYVVSDSINHVLLKAEIGKAVSLFPGAYRLTVNNTETGATVRRREVATVRTGSLVVRGTTNELYYVLDDSDEQLAYANLEKPVALFPGRYVVTVNNTSMKANVNAGGQTDLHTGNIRVTGLTDEYYYVTDSADNALNYQDLNKAIALFPGHFFVSVNNTVMEGIVFEQDTTEFVTGSVVLNGRGAGYYYVLDEAGNQLAYNTLNKALSFFPNLYTIRLGPSMRHARVAAGELTKVSAFD